MLTPRPFSGAAVAGALLPAGWAGAGTVARKTGEKLAERLSVKDLAAVKGDGSDETALVQAALDAAPAYAEVFFPPGTYGLTPSLSGNALTFDKPLGLSGAGPSSHLKVLADAPDYGRVIGSDPALSSPLPWASFRDLRLDQNPAQQTVGDCRAVTDKAQFVIDVRADDLTVADCWIDYCGVNAILTSHYGTRRARIEGNRFTFARTRAVTQPYYDNSAVYARAEDAVINGNHFLAAAVAGVFALGAIEVHARNAQVLGNQSRNFATLCNWAPTAGSPGHMAAVIAHNLALGANKPIQLWVVEDSRGLIVSDNVLEVRQILWRLKAFGGIVAATGAAVLDGFQIARNVIGFDEEYAARTVVDAIDGAAEQQYVCNGIGLHIDGATYSNGLIDDNIIDRCPFTALKLGGEAQTSVFRNVRARRNLLVDCGRNVGAASNSYRAQRRLVGVCDKVSFEDNRAVENFTTINSRYQLRADQGTFTRCAEIGNRFEFDAASGAAAPVTTATTGWTKSKAPLHGTMTYDPASIADGANGAQQSVSVLGAELGDTVTLSFNPRLPLGWTWGAGVEAAGDVRFFVRNQSGSSADLPSMTVRAEVR